MLRHNIIIMIE